MEVLSIDTYHPTNMNWSEDVTCTCTLINIAFGGPSTGGTTRRSIGIVFESHFGGHKDDWKLHFQAE